MHPGPHANTCYSLPLIFIESYEHIICMSEVCSMDCFSSGFVLNLDSVHLLPYILHNYAITMITSVLSTTGYKSIESCSNA